MNWADQLPLILKTYGGGTTVLILFLGIIVLAVGRIGQKLLPILMRHSRASEMQADSAERLLLRNELRLRIVDLERRERESEERESVLEGRLDALERKVIECHEERDEYRQTMLRHVAELKVARDYIEAVESTNRSLNLILSRLTPTPRQFHQDDGA